MKDSLGNAFKEKHGIWKVTMEKKRQRQTNSGMTVHNLDLENL
jgi:hypothetical protein